MKPVTKFFVWTGVACAILGPPTVAAVYTSVGLGMGQGVGVTVQDGVPALVKGLRDYEGGSGVGMFDGGWGDGTLDGKDESAP